MGSRRERIDRYDLVEVIGVPEDYAGLIDVGDIGVVVATHGSRRFEVECVQPGGSPKWIATLGTAHVRLRSKDPYNTWEKQSLERDLMRTSIRRGAWIGAGFGVLMGSSAGAITLTASGVLIGGITGLLLGTLTGMATAALTAKTAGTTGGIGVGYFTGMVFGGVLGLVVGGFFPPSLRMKAQTEGLPVLDALVMGRFETAVMTGFLLSILGTIVGAWVGETNLAPRDLKNR